MPEDFYPIGSKNNGYYRLVSLLYLVIALIGAGICLILCCDNDTGTEPSETTEYIDVYVVTGIDGKPPESMVDHSGYGFPAAFNIRLDEESNTFSGYVEITTVGWLPISEVYAFSDNRFSVTAPDSFLHLKFYQFSSLKLNPPVLSGVFTWAGPALDTGGHTFDAQLTNVPAVEVMNDEYYFAAGPGSTKVFIVESIGGRSPDDLPAEWGSIFPTMLEVNHNDRYDAVFYGRIYFSSLGWIDIQRDKIDNNEFWIDCSDSLTTLCLCFSELQYDPPVLSGLFEVVASISSPLSQPPQPFVSRRTIMPVEELLGN